MSGEIQNTPIDIVAMLLCGCIRGDTKLNSMLQKSPEKLSILGGDQNVHCLRYQGAHNNGQGSHEILEIVRLKLGRLLPFPSD